MKLSAVRRAGEACCGKCHIRKGVEIYCPYEKLYQEDELVRIRNLIDRNLPACIATALKLRYLESYANNEIAKIMSVTKKTVASYVYLGSHFCFKN